jgi:hypothetical protein
MNGTNFNVENVKSIWDDAATVNASCPPGTVDNRDGIHLYGPLSNVAVRNYASNGDDDSFAINTDEAVATYNVGTAWGYQRFSWSGGAISNVFADNMTFAANGVGACQGVRWYGESTTNGVATVSNITLRNISGALSSGAYNMYNTGITAAGPITIDGWYVTGTYNHINVPQSTSLALRGIPPGVAISTSGTVPALDLSSPQALVHTTGSPYSLLGIPGYYWNNTSGAYGWVLDVPAPGKQYCFGNYSGRTGVLTITSTTGVYIVYKGANGTVTTGTLVSGGVAGDFVCMTGVDSTHYNVTGAGYGTWTNN